MRYVLLIATALVIGALLIYVKNPEVVHDFVLDYRAQTKVKELAEAERQRWLAEMQPQGSSNLQPLPQEQICNQDEDCVLVANSCNRCCGQTAVSMVTKPEFENRLQKCRENFRGGSCACVVYPMVARCREQKCLAVPAPQRNADQK